MRRFFTIAAVAVACSVVLVVPALAQGQAGRPASTGPLVLEPIPSTITFAPDFKATQINGTTGELVGGYIVKQTDSRLFMGGGAYGLVNPRRDARLFYAGFIVGSRIAGTDRANVSAKGLIGIGDGTVFQTVTAPGFPTPRRGMVDGGQFRFGLEDNFVVFEPGVDFQVQIVDGVNLTASAGYRVTSAAHSINDELRGVTGGIAIQFVVGK